MLDINHKNLSKELFERILSSFATMFKCERNLFSQPGITIIRDRSTDDRLHIWYVDKRAIIWSDKSLVEKFNKFVEFYGTEQTPAVQDFIDYYSEEDLTVDVTSSIHFLDSKDFIPKEVESEFHVKQLIKEDSSDLEQLLNSCIYEEVDEAYVEIDHPIVMGAYSKDTLVAASSVTTNWGDFSDIGVITHPEFRGLGLGKAVVSAACQKILEDGDRIPLYRADEIVNPASAKIAQSLGFKKYLMQYSLEFKNKK